MPALITTFDERGEEKTVKPAPFRLVGRGSNRALEVQVTQNSTVEIPLEEILDTLKKEGW